MGNPHPAVDLQLFERATALFAQKRASLDVDAVGTLASDIVRRLSRTVQPSAKLPETIISSASISAFCDTLVRDDPYAALQFIDERRAEGITRQDIYLGYIGAAAAVLGERWDDDRVSLIDVTVATGHLYALMRSLRDEETGVRRAYDARKSALFATVPGEDHGIGITIAADIFRQAGWEIDLQIGIEHDGLMTHVARSAPGVIGLSLSTERRLGELMRLVVAMRITVPNAIIGVASGTGPGPDQLKNLVDIDLLFGDAQSALNELNRMVRLRA